MKGPLTHSSPPVPSFCVLWSMGLGKSQRESGNHFALIEVQHIRRLLQTQMEQEAQRRKLLVIPLIWNQKGPGEAKELIQFN